MNDAAPAPYQTAGADVRPAPARCQHRAVPWILPAGAPAAEPAGLLVTKARPRIRRSGLTVNGYSTDATAPAYPGRSSKGSTSSRSCRATRASRPQSHSSPLSAAQ